jgi:hypothetical protein
MHVDYRLQFGWSFFLSRIWVGICVATLCFQTQRVGAWTITVSNVAPVQVNLTFWDWYQDGTSYGYGTCNYAIAPCGSMTLPGGNCTRNFAPFDFYQIGTAHGSCDAQNTGQTIIHPGFTGITYYVGLNCGKCSTNTPCVTNYVTVMIKNNSPSLNEYSITQNGQSVSGSCAYQAGADGFATNQSFCSVPPGGNGRMQVALCDTNGLGVSQAMGSSGIGTDGFGCWMSLNAGAWYQTLPSSAYSVLSHPGTPQSDVTSNNNPPAPPVNNESAKGGYVPPSGNGTSTNGIVWPSDAWGASGSGTNPTVSALVAGFGAQYQQLGLVNQELGRLMSGISAMATNGGGVTGGTGTNGGPSWTNGLTDAQFVRDQNTNGLTDAQFLRDQFTNSLTLAQLSNYFGMDTNSSSKLSKWWADNSGAMTAATNAVGAGKGVFDALNSTMLGPSEVESGGDDELLNVDLGNSVPRLVVRTNDSNISSVGNATRIMFAWLAVVLLYIKCVMWTMESLQMAANAQQARTAGEAIFGNNVNAASSFAMGIVIVAGLAALPTIIAAVISTIIGVATPVAIRPDLKTVMGPTPYYLLLKFFPVAVWITAALNYPVAKVGIAYVCLVYQAFVRLLSGI